MDESLPSPSSASLPIPTKSDSDIYNDDQSVQATTNKPTINEKKKKKKKKHNYVQISIPEKPHKRNLKRNIIDVANDDDDNMKNIEGRRTASNVAPSLPNEFVSLKTKPKREDSNGRMGDVPI